jgi:phytoene/squalene synthetase
MKNLYDNVSARISKNITNQYSTSFSLGIRLLKPSIRPAIYAIYGFVRLADEIVDSFHDYNKKELLERFKKDTYLAIEEKISLNPVLNAFQQAVHDYNIDLAHIATFLRSMESDLKKSEYEQLEYEEYINGSAEVVGLMCLKVFCYGDEAEYARLESSAMSLGSAFQKINFLRDMKQDTAELGRIYFPGVDLSEFDMHKKREIEADIEKDFKDGLHGIKNLPESSKFGVYVAYIYYYSLFKKIQNTPASEILNRRIRISNEHKVGLLGYSYLKYQMRLL